VRCAAEKGKRAVVELLARDPELQRVDVEDDQGTSKRDHKRSVQLTAITIAWGAGLVFFTFAHVVRANVHQRRIFATAGLIVAIAGVVLPLVTVRW
jgi:hypothetical protein